MRNVILSDAIDIQDAGVHVYTKNMIENLQRLYPENYLALRNGWKPIIRFKKEKILKEYRIPGYRALRMFILLPLWLNKNNPDYVIEPAHFGPFNLRKGIKRVTIIHDLTPIKFPQWHRWHSQTLQKIFLSKILKKATLILTNSKSTLNDLCDIYPFCTEKAFFAYPGIDTYYQPGEQMIQAEKEPFLLYTGTIEPRKNLVTLLKAYELFRRNSSLKHPLIIVGKKGWKTAEFDETLTKHPFKEDIVLKGYVSQEELRDLYLKTSAFIYPSFYEGFGFPVVEAMGCGAPCIVSRSSSLTEAGGDAALYFDPENEKELCTCIIKVTEQKETRNNMIKKGRIHSKKFRWDDFAKTLHHELQRKIENN